MRNTALQRDLLRTGLTIGSGAGRIPCNRILGRIVASGSGGPRGQFGESDRTMPKLQQGRINNSTVDALPIADKEAVFWDSELQGFGVRVYRSGGKVYVVQVRSGGKSKRYTIGRHGVITAEEARRKAAMTVAAIKGGQEPELSSSGWVVGPPRKKSGLSAIDGMPNSIHRNILTSLVRRYDCRVMNNTHRAEYVECLVAEFLGTGWTLPWTNGYDWAPWGYRTRLRGTAGDQAVCGPTALARWEPDSDEIAQVRYCPPQGLLDAGRRVDRGPRPACRPLRLRLARQRKSRGRRSSGARPMAVFRRADRPLAGEARQHRPLGPQATDG